MQQADITESQDTTAATPAVILDLGCGNSKVPGAIGVDIQSTTGAHVTHDLGVFPYPFSDNYADEFHLKHVLEHLPSTIRVMEEVWRIGKPGARVHISVPHYTGIYAWKDPTHVRCFTSESFGYFGENGYSYYTHARFSVRSVSLVYSMEQRRQGIVRRTMIRTVQAFLDRHPTCGERHLAYLVGGIDEVRFTLEVVKS